MKPDPTGAALLALAAALLLSQLGNGRLWQDEAETAVLGRNTLRYGYPRAFDGVNHLNPALPTGRGYAWTYHSWLPMYMAAGSFWLLGPSTLAARLPFALLGLASIGLAFSLMKRLVRDPGVARLTLLFLVTSVPLLLHMRQCRYYAPAVFFSLWVVSAYWRFLHHRRWSGPELVLSSVLLFHANHGAFLPVVASLALHFAWTQPERRDRFHGILVVGSVAALTLPWMVFLQAEQHHQPFSWDQIRHHLQFYFRQINRFLVPVVFWGLAWLPLRPRGENMGGAPASPERPAWRLVGCLIGVGLGFLILIPEQRHFRYLIHLVPWFYLVQAVLLIRLFRARRWLGITLTALLILSDLVHYSGPSVLAAQVPVIRSHLSSPDVRPRSLILEFLGELSHPYRGPVDGIIEWLGERAHPGETVKVPYEEHPILFYTDLQVEPSRSPADFGQETFPDWIILRRDWLPSGFFDSPYYEKIQSRYRKVLLDAPDIPWQNRPDPGYHRFQTDREAPPVILFQKRRAPQ